MLEENDSFQEFISQFKDGVSDALLLGKSADVNVTSAYKQGYDFGMTNAENGIGGLDEL